MSNEIKSKPRTALRVGEVDVEVTFDDAQAIQRVLLDHLRQSDYPDRDELLKWSAPAFIDVNGNLRIGRWLLGSDDQGLSLLFRDRPGPLAAKAHRASLVNQDGRWLIIRLQAERIRLPEERRGARPRKASGRR